MRQKAAIQLDKTSRQQSSLDGHAVLECCRTGAVETPADYPRSGAALYMGWTCYVVWKRVAGATRNR